MSSYLTVYYHDQKHDSYVSLGTFSRSTTIYRVFYDNGYSGNDHKIIPITIDDLQNMIGAVQTDIDYYKKKISETKEKSQTILGLKNHTIKEKMEAVADNEEFLPEYEEDLDYSIHAQNYLIFLQDIIESNQFSYKPKNGDTFTPDKNKLIYCGIDCSSPIDYSW